MYLLKFQGLIGWFITIILLGMVLSMMARKGKGKQIDKGKDASQGKGKPTDKGKGKAKNTEKRPTRKNKRVESTLALRDEQTDSDTDSDPNNNMTAAEEGELRTRRPRSHSCGVYGDKEPLKPKRINISNGQ